MVSDEVQKSLLGPILNVSVNCVWSLRNSLAARIASETVAWPGMAGGSQFTADAPGTSRARLGHRRPAMLTVGCDDVVKVKGDCRTAASDDATDANPGECSLCGALGGGAWVPPPSGKSAIS
jgi:hypothetical protein